MSEETEHKKQHWILHLISAHPVGVIVIFFGALAGITALGPAFFPWWTAPKRELAYCINPVRTPIIQKLKLSDISVSFKGTSITGDITAAQIAIMNNGREPIRTEDILSPIILRTSNASIYEVSVLQSNRAAFAGFHLDRTNLANGHVGVDWKILQHKDAVLVQILYSGSPNEPILLDGEIVAQGSPRWIKSGKPRYIWLFLYASMLGFGALYLEKASIWLLRKLPNKKGLAITIFAGLSLVYFAVLLWGTFFGKTPPATPFGF